jgi:hypothetical protein
VQINPGPTPEEKQRAADLEKGRAIVAAQQAEQERVKANAAALNREAETNKGSVRWGTHALRFGGRTSKIGKKFDRCVKAVRNTVRARKGSTKESAAIAICTKSVLQTRGRTLKRYKKGRLVTQRKFRGGTKEALVQIAADLEAQRGAIVSKLSTNRAKDAKYIPTVGPEVIAAALAVVPTREAPSGLFGRFMKNFSPETDDEEVREFLEEVSTNNSYTFDDPASPLTISGQLRELAVKLSRE